MSDFAKHDIERELERDRVALARSLAALRDRLQPANLMAEGKDTLLQHASPLVSRLDGAVRGQPLVAAVAGIALAALVFGRRPGNDTEAASAVPAMAGTKFEALTRWEDEGGPPAPEPVDPNEDWLSEAQGLRAKALELLAQIDDAARRKLAPAAQLAKHRAEVTRALAAETGVALAKGLGSLTGAARDQTLQARERIYLARIAMAERGRERVDANPLAVGAALALAGAAVACLFPQTATEDRLLGEASDQLSADVKAMARREAVKASALGRSLSDALKTDMRRASTLFASQDDRQPVRHH
ncbi:DUF3618 domain-containing protein [Tabrizicola sp.]|uniref:DUF3618 domain-containing protein n=1 Tax=Tabrizicola sp. TaxID=2005166 RepID=UPI001A5DADC2|nr:DUF3618 domain-containing protein [Tabrizicola sp.]MBL9061041.1 DUF3618 domain-containing protein [Tabrizicola sp.]